MNIYKNRKSHAASLLTVRIGKRLGKYHRATRWIGITGIAFSTGYLGWRLIYTSEGINPFLFWLLWGAELIGWFSMALFVRDAWNLTPADDEFGQVSGSSAVFIPTFDEELEVLEPTLMAAMKIRGAKEVWLLDDGRRNWVRDLAIEYGAKYLARSSNEHAKAGNINNALKKLNTSFVLILDADHVASPDILENTTGYFVNEKVAVVQTPHGFRNLDSVQHYDNEVHDQSLFFDVLLPGRQRSGAVFWCGSGAVLRVSALKSVGGLATNTITEDLETTLALNRAGFKAVYHNEILLKGLAPQNLAAFIIQRYRWARGTLEILLGAKSPIFGRGYAWRARLSYLSNFVYYLVSVQHMIFAGILVWLLITAQLPLNPASVNVVILWGIQQVLAILAVWGISGGKQLPFGGSQNAWMNSSIHVGALVDTVLRRKQTFKVTPKGGTSESALASLALLWLPGVAAALLTGALITRVLSELVWHFLAPLPAFGWILSLFFSLFELSILVPMLVKYSTLIQTRATWREPVEVDASIHDSWVRVVDLHESGLKLVGSAEDLSGVGIGDKKLVTLDLKNAAGLATQATGTLTVASKTPISEQKVVSIGGPVEWSTSQDRSSVVEFCYLVVGSVKGA